MDRINKHSKTTFNKQRDLFLCFFLVMATLAVYWQAQNYDFVNFDDDKYVIENRHVQEGLTLDSIIWAFTTTHAGNWHPLTWLSHMLDIQLYGMNAGGHHLTSLFFHIANTLLLFFVLRKMTAGLWRSGFVAALFALHPLHVESVAWVSERKDVLSTFFWMLTLWSYIWYVEHPAVNRYLWVVLFFILGLMSKPMLVTLPFVLLLLDFYPLCRFQFQQSDCSDNSQQWSAVLRLVFEKLPLFVLAAMSSAVTFYAEKHGGKVKSLEENPLVGRIANALVAYAKYVVKMIYPSKLAVLYPHPGMLPLWNITGALLLLIALSFLAIRVIKQRPYFAVGWLWYIGTLVPVIGLVQVGNQSMADRYTYIPLIGLFVIIAWGVPEIAARWRRKKIWLFTSATFLLLILMVVTWKQVRYWKNSITLFEHTLKVTSNNSLAHNNLGAALDKEGRIDEAIGNYLQALRIKPDYVIAHYNLSLALSKQDRVDEAIEHYLQVLRIKPDFEKAHYSLGLAWTKQGQTGKAIYHYLEALRIKPDYKIARINLGVALEEQGRIDEAIYHYIESLRVNPDEGTHNNLGNALQKKGKINEAIYHYLEALHIKPDFADAQFNLGIALEKLGRTDKAIDHYSEALRIKPDFAAAHNNLGIVLEKKGRKEEAIYHYLEALRIKPDFEEVHNNLGIALFLKGNIEGAIYHFQEALRIEPGNVAANINLKKILMKQQQEQ